MPVAAYSSDSAAWSFAALSAWRSALLSVGAFCAAPAAGASSRRRDPPSASGAIGWARFASGRGASTSRKKAAETTPRSSVFPSHAPYDFSSLVKKKRRAWSELVCQPPITAVSHGPSTHLDASRAVVDFASIELRPSTDSATATRRPLLFRSRIAYSRPRSAST